MRKCTTSYAVFHNESVEFSKQNKIPTKDSSIWFNILGGTSIYPDLRVRSLAESYFVTPIVQASFVWVVSESWILRNKASDPPYASKSPVITNTQFPWSLHYALLALHRILAHISSIIWLNKHEYFIQVTVQHYPYIESKSKQRIICQWCQSQNFHLAK